MNSNTTLRPVAPPLHSFMRYEQYAGVLKRSLAGPQPVSSDRLVRRPSRCHRRGALQAHVDAAVADVHDILEDPSWSARLGGHEIRSRAATGHGRTQSWRRRSSIPSPASVQHRRRRSGIRVFLELPSPPAGAQDSTSTAQTVAAVDASPDAPVLLAFPVVPYAQLERDSSLWRLIDGQIRRALGSKASEVRDIALGLHTK